MIYKPVAFWWSMLYRERERERERDGTLNHNCLSRCLQAKVSLKKGPQKETVLIDIALSLQQHSPRHGKTVEMNRHI